MLKDDLLKDGLISQEEYDNWAETPKPSKEVVEKFNEFMDEFFI